MFYLLGSLLFAFAMMTAFAVMILNVSHYRRAMMAALRTLSFDGWTGAPAPAACPAEAFRLPAGMTLRQQLQAAA